MARGPTEQERRPAGTSTLFVGVDPGKNGYISVYDGAKIRAQWPIPYLDGRPDTWKIYHLLCGLRRRGARYLVIELQAVFGKEGKISAFTTGFGYARLLTIVELVFSADYAEVRPTKAHGQPGWKEEMGVKLVDAELPRLPRKPKDKTQRAAWKVERKRLEAERRKLKAIAKKAAKDESVIQAQRLAGPDHSFLATARSKNSHDGKAESFLLAVLAYRRHQARKP